MIPGGVVPVLELVPEVVAGQLIGLGAAAVPVRRGRGQGPPQLRAAVEGPVRGRRLGNCQRELIVSCSHKMSRTSR